METTVYATPADLDVKRRKALIVGVAGLAICAAGFVLALPYLGGEAAQISIGVSDKVVRAFQGLLLFLVLGCDTLIRYRVQIVRSTQTTASEARS